MRFSRQLVMIVAVLLFSGVAMANAVDSDTSSTPSTTGLPGDVNFGIKDPTSCKSTGMHPNASACYTITSSPFSFTMPTVPGGGSLTIGFTNKSGMTLNSLEMDLFTGTGVTLSLFTCSPTAFFNTCLVTKLGTSSLPNTNEFQVLLENVGKGGGKGCHPDGDNDKDDMCGGIPNGGVVFFTFSNPPCTTSGWGKYSTTTCPPSDMNWSGGGTTITVSTTPEPAPMALLLTGLVPLWALRRRWLN